MKNILNYLLLFFFLSINIVFAQNQLTNKNKTISEIPDRISDIEILLKNINFKIKQLKDISIDNIVKNTLINNKNIDERINELLEYKKVNIKSIHQHAKKISKMSDLINISKSEINNQLKSLKNINKNIIKTTSLIDILKQLLSNPINQKNLTINQLQKLPAIESSIKFLSLKYQKAVEYKENQINIIDNSINLLNRWQKALSEAIATRQQLSKKPTEINRLEEKKDNYRDKYKALEEQLNNQYISLSISDIENLQSNIYQQKTMAWLIDIDISLIKIIKSSIEKTYTKKSNNSIKQLENELNQVNTALNKLSGLKNNVNEKLSEFNKNAKFINEKSILESAIQERLNDIDYQYLQLFKKPEELSLLISKQKKAMLFTRDNFFNNHFINIKISDLWGALLQITYQVQISFKTLFKQIQNNFFYTISITLIATLLIYITTKAAIAISPHISWSKNNKSEQIILLNRIFYFLKKHLYLLSLFILIILLVIVSNVPYPSNNIILYLIYSLIFLLLCFEFTNIEFSFVNTTKKSIKKIVIIVFLAFSILFYNLAYASSVSIYITSLFEKMSMLGTIIFIISNNKNINNYINKGKEKKSYKPYNILLGLINYIPWLIIISCSTNLFGYSAISLILLKYLWMFVIYITIANIGLTIINEVRKQLKLYTLHKFNYGSFIAQHIIPPFSFITKIIWLWVITYIILSFLNLNKDSFLISKIINILSYPLFTLSNKNITPITIALLILFVYLIFRVAKWIKIFSYQWLYANIQDLGTRNSLSIFTQYVIALIGVIIALNILGIDLTSLAVFAGALGVGIGLGLQDIAKNFISGILLLIERPLRTGDWVAIDGSEGTVKSIGMRAITMETFDKQEVIIPNGNAISNSFTNFTHSNTIIRTVLYVGAGYKCDPQLVIMILNNVMDNTDGVLKEPKYKVVMWEYADSSINYRIQYYIDLDKNGLWETKTNVLKTIWYEFKDNNIEIPLPQRDINFRNILQNNISNSDKNKDRG